MIRFLLEIPCSYLHLVGIIFVEVKLKNVVFRDETPCGSLRTYVSEENIPSTFRVKTMREL
jgi:hypothetical protein